MKTVKYILILLLSIGTFNSCLIENETDIDLNDDGPNLAGFEESRKTLPAIADGKEYDFDLKVKVFGPTWSDVKNDVTLTIAADPTSTAIAGKHFKIKNPTITLSPGDNMLGLFKITMLTAGIQTPLAVAPVLVLKVTQVTGDTKVINSGKPITLTLNYACPSFLAGTYSVTVTRIDYTGTVTTYPAYDEVITETGIGEYRTSFVGHYIPTNGSPNGLGAGTEGFTFQDVCGVLTVPEQNLNDYYSNIVVGTDFGSANTTTGTLVLKYSISFAAGIRKYEATYVKK